MIYLFSKRPDPGGFSDEELQIAARAVQDAILRSLEAESEAKHTFSESFLERMNALFRKDERRNGIKRALQHAAIIVRGDYRDRCVSGWRTVVGFQPGGSGRLYPLGKKHI